MNRAERREHARRGTYRDMPRQLRKLSELTAVVNLADRARLRRAADRLDKGDPPLKVLADVEDVLARVRRLSGGR